MAFSKSNLRHPEGACSPRPKSLLAIVETFRCAQGDIFCQPTLRYGKLKNLVGSFNIELEDTGEYWLILFQSTFSPKLVSLSDRSATVQILLFMDISCGYKILILADN
jgi:hypothetical protein